MNQTAQKLKEISTLDSLVGFLRDDMGWPIETDNFEDVVFEYSAEELGIDKASAAKIESIRRLQPLTANQPWGVFFVEFEPKKLPVTALRRILNEVVNRKRAATNAADRVTWDMEDLMFVTAMGGGGDTRKMTFAHFSRGDESRLPSLKVIAWDDQDTPLAIESLAEKLTEKLAWPHDEEDTAAWREAWSSAFTLQHREVITTSQKLANVLAELARDIRARILEAIEIETESGALTQLMKAFQQTLIHDLDEADFADMYAQTIAYGLLSARILDPRGGALGMGVPLPVANPFLKELMEEFLHLGGGGRHSHARVDFDELGVNEVVDALDRANIAAVVDDFGDRNPEEDPVIHFYETFLSVYDPQVRMQRGVFYTPRPVVSFMVRATHERLRTAFGLEDGLADVSTWEAVARKHEWLQIPEGQARDEPFVKVLDPATGTGTFLVECIEVVHQTMKVKWETEGASAEEIADKWNDYVPTHLIPRLFGFEILMAPYAIAHLKVGLKLLETGYRFDTRKRANIYLTNALDRSGSASEQISISLEALAHEATSVADVKRRTRFTVVLGNPPYAQYSQNLGDDARALVAPYKQIQGQPIAERGALALERNLQDDYVKFLRLAELTIMDSSAGVVSMITNHSYRSNLTLRGMRHHLLTSFQSIEILDLHGSSQVAEASPEGSRDDNVFDIQQGVAICRLTRCAPSEEVTVRIADMWGDRDAKYRALVGSLSLPSWIDVAPKAELYLFQGRDEAIADEYRAFTALDNIFKVYGSAVTTGRDGLVVGFTESELADRVDAFLAPSRTDDEVAAEFSLTDSAIWSLSRARASLKETHIPDTIVPVDYRPFDTRFLCYTDALVSSPRHPTMDHMSWPDSVGLAVCKQQGVPGFSHVFVSRRRFDEGLVSNRSREKTYCFPLYLFSPSEGTFAFHTEPNIREEPALSLAAAVNSTWHRAGPGANREGVGAHEVLCYVYAILHSTAYRERYMHELKLGFPRVPMQPSGPLFEQLVPLGNSLLHAHTEPASLAETIMPRYVGPKAITLVAAHWAESSVRLDGGEDGEAQFLNVARPVWEFRVGAYQPLQKFLKDRRGRILVEEDRLAFSRMAAAVAETLQQMLKIDDAIALAGGWPNAFDGKDSSSV